MLDHLPDDALVLDLGCRTGSYPAADYRFRTLRVDTVRPHSDLGLFVQADSVHLPFQSSSFDLVVLNHVLEHFVRLQPALEEIGRVVKKDGAVFVAVPDASTISDRIYRRMFRDAGGHVNRFTSAAELERTLALHFGLAHTATRTLYTSFNFLNRKNTRDRAVRGHMNCVGLPEPLVVITNLVVRLIDRLFGKRASVYGWALYFGKVGEPVDLQALTNVCVRCGQAHPSGMLEKWRRVRRKFILPLYQCPGCETLNTFARDRPARHPR